MYKFLGLTLIKKAIDVPVQMQLGFLSNRFQNKLKWSQSNRDIIYDNIFLPPTNIWYEYQWHNTINIYNQIMSLSSAPLNFPTKLLLVKSNQCDKKFHQNDLHNNDKTLPLMTVYVGNNRNLLVKSNNICENMYIESGDALIFNNNFNDMNNLQFKYYSIESNSGPKEISQIIGDNVLYFTFRT